MENRQIVIEPASASTAAGARWRQSKWLLLAEGAAIVCTLVVASRHGARFTTTPILLLVGFLSLRVRRVGWRRLGLRLYRDWQATLGLGIAAGVLLACLQLLIVQPTLVWLTGAQPDLSDVQNLRGNVRLVPIGLVLVWVLAAFGEELVYRGYLMNRLADIGGGTRLAWAGSVLVVSAVFGFVHIRQGLTGQIEQGIGGLWLGLLYLGTGRNLALPILAHGIADTIYLVLIYCGRFPGL